METVSTFDSEDDVLPTFHSDLKDVGDFLLSPIFGLGNLISSGVNALAKTTVAADNAAKSVGLDPMALGPATFELSMAARGFEFAAPLMRSFVGATTAKPVAKDLFTEMSDFVAGLDFSTAPDKAVFYSGPGQGVRAAKFAEKTGGMTIEMTPGGKALAADSRFQSLSPGEQYQLWKQASTPFAQNASGSINAFIKGANPGGTFRTVEEPILNGNKNVYRQILHY